MLKAVLAGFVLAIIAPWIYQIGRSAAAWIIALLPFGLTVYFLSFINRIAQGEAIQFSYAWANSLNVNLSFYVDGLSLLFSLLISGIGTLIFIYAGSYLSGHAQLGRLYAFLLIFMSAMLGLVLADNIITLFIFWELTSISSYLLIGFDHSRAEARAAATQALIITGAGGLVLLVGLILLGQIGGHWELSALLQEGELIRQHALYLPILLLILLGAFTKSAQFPFHFWLPGAMEAPTPISAYLHSATMVKAGIYLLARLTPIMGGTQSWFILITSAGLVTMLVGAVLAIFKTDLKRILAYSTISALGTLVMLLGINTEAAIEAAVVFLMVHSFYKGTLFLVAGAVDHETGTRDIAYLGGLRRVMPIIATAAGLAALSMAGIPGLLGFVGKELIYEANLHAPSFAMILTAGSVLANIFMVAVGGIVGYRVFFGPAGNTPKKGHEAPLAMWVGPVLLAGLGLITGLLPDLLSKSIVSPAVSGISGHEVELHLALWHGLTTALGLSAITILGGIGLYAARNGVRERLTGLVSLGGWGPEKLYNSGMSGLDIFARVQARFFQSGYLRFYLLIIILTTVGLVGTTLVTKANLDIAIAWEELITIPIYEYILVVVILLATLSAVRSKSRLAAIASLGIVGYGMSLLFSLFGAPDLAMTQVSIETLSVVLLVLIISRLPRFATISNRLSRTRDLLVAIMAGALMTTLILFITALPFRSRLSPFFAESSYTLAKGHNIVNVILVDFRGLDTMGEITVLSVAAAGVFGLLKLQNDRRAQEDEE